MIVVAGEALVDLVPRDGVLVPLPGGSPYNVAIGLARLDRPVHFLGRLSTDGFGRWLAARLRDEGVALDLATGTAAPTTLAVVHLDAGGTASYGFYLDGTAAAGLTADDLPDLPDGAALHVSLGAVTLDAVPAGAAVEALVAAARNRHVIVLDPNVRPSVIADLAAYGRRLDRLVAGVDVVRASVEDLASLHAGTDALDLARAWSAAGPVLVVVTLGVDGAVALRADGTTVAVDAEPVEVVVDTVGAGDAFTAGLLAWLDGRDLLGRDELARLAEADLTAALRYATRVAASTCARAGADPPRSGEV